MFRPGRLLVLFLLLFAIVMVFFIKMYRLQLIEHGESDELISTYSMTETISSSRGDILDRNGTLLVTSRMTYNIGLSRSALLEHDTSTTSFSTLPGPPRPTTFPTRTLFRSRQPPPFPGSQRCPPPRGTS